MKKQDELYKHTKKCWANGIVIVPEPHVSRFCTINILRNGKIYKKGEKFFCQKLRGGTTELSEKIAELYEYYYNKIIAKEQKDDRIRDIKTA